MLSTSRSTSPIKRPTSPITSLLESFPPGKRSEALIHSLRLGMVVSDQLRSPVESSPARLPIPENKEDTNIADIKKEMKVVEKRIEDSTPVVIKVSFLTFSW